jgi:hypothetical protein
MKQETRIILSALRNFLDRPEIKGKTVVATMPADARLGDLSGKDVDIPLTSVFQGLFNKVSFKQMAEILDANNDVVAIFIEELSNELKSYVPITESVSIKTKEKEVKDISTGLKGDVDDKNE